MKALRSAHTKAASNFYTHLKSSIGTSGSEERKDYSSKKKWDYIYIATEPVFDHIIPCNHTINWRESPSCFAISPFHHCLLGKISVVVFSDAIKGSFLGLRCALLGLTTIEVELRIESVFGYIGNFHPLIFPFSSFHHFQRRGDLDSLIFFQVALQTWIQISFPKILISR